MRIVVADDDRIIRTLLTRMLETWGHDVVATADGAEAWRAIEAEKRGTFASASFMGLSPR